MRSQAFLRELAGFANISMEGAPKAPKAGRLPRGTVGRVIMLGAVEDPTTARGMHIAVVRADKEGTLPSEQHHYIITSPREVNYTGLTSTAIYPWEIKDVDDGVVLSYPKNGPSDFRSPDLFVPLDRTLEPARLGNVAVSPFMEIPEPEVFTVLDAGAVSSDI